MKHIAIALALTLVLTGALTACDSKNNTMADRRSSTNGTYTGQVSRQYDQSGKAWDYLDDARYSAGSNGKVYGGDGNSVTRDLTQGARDLTRNTENAARDLGRGVGDAARDVGDAARDLGKDMTGKY